MTKHNANANDDIYACVTLQDTNVNDIIHDCVAPHDAHTCILSGRLLCLHLHTQMHLGSSLSLSCHLHGHPCVCGLFTLILPFYPSSRSMLSRDKRLLLDTWNTFGLQENVFGNQFSTFDTPRDHRQRISPCAPQRERGSVQQAAGSGTPFMRDDKQSKDTIPMPTFARRPSTMSSTLPVKFPQNSLGGPQIKQISELQFDKFRAPQSFLVWKYDSKIM